MSVLQSMQTRRRTLDNWQEHTKNFRAQDPSRTQDRWFIRRQSSCSRNGHDPWGTRPWHPTWGGFWLKPVLAKNLQTLKATSNLVQKELSRKTTMWIFTGVMAMMIGTSMVLPTKDKEEGLLASSIIALDSFLTHLACFQVQQSVVTISSSSVSYTHLTLPTICSV